MNDKFVDINNSKNIYCDHCQFWVREKGNHIRQYACSCNKSKHFLMHRNYWNRCKCFAWRTDILERAKLEASKPPVEKKENKFPDARKGCPMRHENGNCLPHGGFCLSVNDCVCEALHNAYEHGKADMAREISGKIVNKKI